MLPVRCLHSGFLPTCTAIPGFFGLLQDSLSFHRCPANVNRGVEKNPMKLKDYHSDAALRSRAIQCSHWQGYKVHPVRVSFTPEGYYGEGSDFPEEYLNLLPNHLGRMFPLTIGGSAVPDRNYVRPKAGRWGSGRG